MVATKNKQTGATTSEIARAWDVSRPYVSKLLKRLGIQPQPLGGYDLAHATALRKQCTIAGRGKRKWARHHPSDERRTCQQCRAVYTAAGALRDEIAASDLAKFCSLSCERDAVNGVTQKATIAKLKARHLENGGVPADFANPERWLNF